MRKYAKKPKTGKYKITVAKKLGRKILFAMSERCCFWVGEDNCMEFSEEEAKRLSLKNIGSYVAYIPI